MKPKESERGRVARQLNLDINTGYKIRDPKCGYGRRICIIPSPTFSLSLLMCNSNTIMCNGYDV